MSRNAWKITGDDTTQKLLNSIAPKHARNLGRSTINATAKTLADKIRREAPEDEGDIKRSVKNSRKKSSPSKPMAVVYAKEIKNGVSPYWWRFQNYGTGGKNPLPAKNFVGKSVQAIMYELDDIFSEHFTQKLKNKIKSEKKKLAKK